MKKSICSVISFLFSLVALVCMLFFEGIAMVFAPSATQRITHYYRYLDPMVFGYGNWFAPIAAICTIACCVLLVFLLFSKVSLKLVLIFQWVAFLMSVLAIVIFSAYTSISILVSILLGLGLVCLYLQRSMNKEVS